MYENGIDVVYEIRADAPGADGVRWSEHRVVTLPGWCAGDAQMAVALHFLGHRTMVSDVRIVDWQPRDEDADDEPFDPNAPSQELADALAWEAGDEER